ncbi:hypothetical protein [Desulfurococcus amylolyticus]|nr:hypothetical protein [Desulfurococcus amylolyticus]
MAGEANYWLGVFSLSDGSIAPSLGGLSLDGRYVQFTSASAHESME